MGALDEALVAAVTGLRDELRQQLLAEQPFADGVLLSSALPTHTHDAADIVSGTLATARIPNLAASIITSGTMATARLGSGSATAATTLHGNSTWSAVDVTSDITGAVPVANGGTGATTAATARSNLATNDAANLTTGTLAAARLGTSPTAATVLHGDSTWSAVSLTAEVTGTLAGVNGGTGVSNSGKTLTIGTSGTAVVGTGTAGDVGYWTGANTIAADAGMTYDSATNDLHVGNTVFAAGFQAGSTVWTLGSFTATPITNTGFVTVTVGGTSRRLMVG
jgi:hypothetical protein